MNSKVVPERGYLNLKSFFFCLILLGIPSNLFSNRFYDNSWTIGEWLISYEGGFVRRGLPGEVIYLISSTFSKSPIVLAWAISVISLIALIALIFHFCKSTFNKSFLLSQLMILAPISGDYLVRKDAFLVCLYGLSLLALQSLKKKILSKIACMFFVNIFSIIAIMSHEGYGIWALPSLFILIYIFERSHSKNIWRSLFTGLVILSPSLIAFFSCWFFKGNADQSLSIHQSWQSIRDIIPSLGALESPNPTGAIEAIGWQTT